VLAFRRRTPQLRVEVPAGPRPSGTAFVLSGGGNLGAAQVGALQALLHAGVRPDVVVGCSVGSLNATFIAADPTAEQADALAEIWRALTDGSVFATPRLRQLANLVRGRDHVLEPDGLRDLVRRLTPVGDLAECKIPVHVVTTDLDAGGVAWHTTGVPEQVLAASAALPGVFPPVEIDGHLHVDGGVLDPLPVARALGLGVATTYVFDVTAGNRATGVRDPKRPRSALDVLVRSFEVSRVANTPDPLELAAAGQEIVCVPMAPARGVDLRDFSHTSRLIDESRAIVEAFLETRGEGLAA
jgi:NTE family protein